MITSDITQPSVLPSSPSHALGRGLGPRALYGALFIDSEGSIEQLDGALQFLLEVLGAETTRSRSLASEADPFEVLVASARRELQPLAVEDYGSSWPARVVKEFAPVGLLDGCWLNAAVLDRRAPRAAADAIRHTIDRRFGCRSERDAAAQSYRRLLRSLGTPWQAIARWDFDESPPCADISYEHGLLPLGLACFADRFWPEALGYELWHSTLGPCPLLQELGPDLQLRQGCIDYLQSGQDSLAAAALTAVRAVAASDQSLLPRLVRGFDAAHASYQRWRRAMQGRNVPMQPRQFVLEGIRRKARFAIDHHRDVQLKGHNLADLFKGGGDAHTLILEHLAATASLVKPGSPNNSPFITHALSLDGPMFDAFTAQEKEDLREWIAGLGRSQLAEPEPALPLAGKYRAAHERRAPQQQAGAVLAGPAGSIAAYLEENEAAPAANWIAESTLGAFFSLLHETLGTGALEVPMAELLDLHALLESVRGLNHASEASASTQATPANGVGSVLSSWDRDWLAGFADPRRSDFAEYRWLLRRYLAFRDRPREQVASKAYLKDLPGWSVVTRALHLRVRDHLPELLGLHLAYEALDEALHGGAYANDACLAIESFFERIGEATPDAAGSLWLRLVHGFWLPVLFTLGSEGQRATLLQAFAGLEERIANVRTGLSS